MQSSYHNWHHSTVSNRGMCVLRTGQQAPAAPQLAAIGGRPHDWPRSPRACIHIASAQVRVTISRALPPYVAPLSRSFAWRRVSHGMPCAHDQESIPTTGSGFARTASLRAGARSHKPHERPSVHMHAAVQRVIGAVATLTPIPLSIADRLLHACPALKENTESYSYAHTCTANNNASSMLMWASRVTRWLAACMACSIWRGTYIQINRKEKNMPILK